MFNKFACMFYIMENYTNINSVRSGDSDQVQGQESECLRTGLSVIKL